MTAISKHFTTRFKSVWRWRCQWPNRLRSGRVSRTREISQQSLTLTVHAKSMKIDSLVSLPLSLLQLRYRYTIDGCPQPAAHIEWRNVQKIVRSNGNSVKLFPVPRMRMRKKKCSFNEHLSIHWCHPTPFKWDQMWINISVAQISKITFFFSVNVCLIQMLSVTNDERQRRTHRLPLDTMSFLCCLSVNGEMVCVRAVVNAKGKRCDLV